MTNQVPKNTKGSLTRRQFIAGLGGIGLAGATGLALKSFGDGSGVPGSGLFRGSPTDGQALGSATTLLSENFDFALNPADYADRVLVIIEMQGGNDGPSMFVPYSQGAYYDSRPNMSIPAEDVIKIDDTVGLHPELEALANQRFAMVEGVGNTLNSFSHFIQQDEWYGAGNRRVGFVAQLGEELIQKYGSEGVVTLSVAGYAPQLAGASAATLSMKSPDMLETYTSDNNVFQAYYRGLPQFRGGAMTSRLVGSSSTLVDLGSRLPRSLDVDGSSPMIQEGQDLGRQLAAAATMIESNSGVRVIHAKIGGFDTHNGHEFEYPKLMRQLNFAIDGFLKRMEAAGMSDRVMVALTSEFGRRAKENGNGFDHGNGSTLMVFGPVNPGRYGVPLDFNNLDEKGNFKTEIPFHEYLRTLAHDWLGVESVLPDTPTIQGLV